MSERFCFCDECVFRNLGHLTSRELVEYMTAIARLLQNRGMPVLNLEKLDGFPSQAAAQEAWIAAADGDTKKH